MKATWVVVDGWSNKSRPHTTEIPDDEFEEGMPENEREQIITEYVEQSFRDSISWSIIRREA